MKEIIVNRINSDEKYLKMKIRNDIELETKDYKYIENIMELFIYDGISD